MVIYVCSLGNGTYCFIVQLSYLRHIDARCLLHYVTVYLTKHDRYVIQPTWYYIYSLAQVHQGVVSLVGAITQLRSDLFKARILAVPYMLSIVRILVA